MKGLVLRRVAEGQVEAWRWQETASEKGSTTVEYSIGAVAAAAAVSQVQLNHGFGLD